MIPYDAGWDRRVTRKVPMVARDPSGPKSPEEFVEQLKELVAANVAGNAQLVARFNDLIRDAAKAVGAARGGEPANAAALLSRWLDFNLASYSVVSTHGLALLNGLLSAAEDALLPKVPSAAEARPTPEPRVELRLEGRPGERVTSAFLVENHFDRPLDVTFEAGDLIPASGTSLAASLIAFEPTTLAIAPRGQAVVQVAVTITGDFVVGQTYITTIRLLGLHAKEVGLSVTVRPPANAAEPSGPPPTQARSTDRRRARPSR
jgi:hypothetical protein